MCFEIVLDLKELERITPTSYMYKQRQQVKGVKIPKHLIHEERPQNP